MIRKKCYNHATTRRSSIWPNYSGWIKCPALLHGKVKNLMSPPSTRNVISRKYLLFSISPSAFWGKTGLSALRAAPRLSENLEIAQFHDLETTGSQSRLPIWLHVCYTSPYLEHLDHSDILTFIPSLCTDAYFSISDDISWKIPNCSAVNSQLYSSHSKLSLSCFHRWASLSPYKQPFSPPPFLIYHGLWRSFSALPWPIDTKSSRIRKVLERLSDPVGPRNLHRKIINTTSIRKYTSNSNAWIVQEIVSESISR